MKVPAVYRPVYMEMKMDVPLFNGDDSWELPLPVIHVVNHERTVRGGFVDNDYTNRMEPSVIIRVSQSLI